MDAECFDAFLEGNQNEMLDTYDGWRSAITDINPRPSTKMVLDATHLRPLWENAKVAIYDLETADFHVVIRSSAGNRKTDKRSGHVWINPRVRLLYDAQPDRFLATTEERWIDLLSPYYAERQVVGRTFGADNKIIAAGSGCVRYIQFDETSYLYTTCPYTTKHDGKATLRGTILARFPTDKLKSVKVDGCALTYARQNTTLTVAEIGDCIGVADDAEWVDVAERSLSGPKTAMSGLYGIDPSIDCLDLLNVAGRLYSPNFEVPVGATAACLLPDFMAGTGEDEYQRVALGSSTVLLTTLEHIARSVNVRDAIAGTYDYTGATAGGHGFVLVRKDQCVPGLPGKYLLDSLQSAKNVADGYRLNSGTIEGLPTGGLTSFDNIKEFHEATKNREYSPTYPLPMTKPTTIDVARDQIKSRTTSRRKEHDGLAVCASLLSGFIHS